MNKAKHLLKLVEEENDILSKIAGYWKEELIRMVKEPGTDYYQPNVNPEEYADTTIGKMLPKMKSGGYKGALSRNPALKKAAAKAGIKTAPAWDALFV